VPQARAEPIQFQDDERAPGAGLSRGLPNNASNQRLDGHIRCPLPADPAIRCRGQEWLLMGWTGCFPHLTALASTSKRWSSGEAAMKPKMEPNIG
jgi:hypothetical protein